MPDPSFRLGCKLFRGLRGKRAPKSVSAGGFYRWQRKIGLPDLDYCSPAWGAVKDLDFAAPAKWEYNKAMFREAARRKIQEELARGAEARAAGFEGRARVCARRAAGAAVREYLDLNNLALPGPSAYDLLAYLRDQPETPAEARQAALRLLERVDEAFALPEGVDLLAEARMLALVLEARIEPGSL